MSSATSVAPATSVDPAASVDPPSAPKITQLLVTVTSNNAMVGAIQGTKPEVEINAELAKVGLSKLVFSNCTILYGHVTKKMIDWKMDSRITSSDSTRFIDGEQFNKISHIFSGPNTYGYRPGTMIVLVRHGRAGNNESETDVISRLKGDQQLVEMLLEKAQLLNPKLNLSDLTEQDRFQLAVNTYRQDSDLTDEGNEEAQATACLIESWLDFNFLVRPPMRIMKSPLKRTEQTALIIAKQLGFKGEPQSCAQALEEDREIGSSYWHHGTSQKKVVWRMKRIRASGKALPEIMEQLKSMMYEAVITVLKNPPRISKEEWESETDEFRNPFIERVLKIWRENIPLDHQITPNPNFDQAPDLLSALAILSKTVIFATENQRKEKDLRTALKTDITILPLDCNESQGLFIEVAFRKAQEMLAKFGGSVCVEDGSVESHGENSEFAPMVKWIVKGAKAEVAAAAEKAKVEALKKATDEGIDPDQALHVGEAAAKQASLECRRSAFVKNLERRLGPGDVDYISTFVLLKEDGSQIVIWCAVHCTPKSLTAKELENTAGDIDPFLKAKGFKVFVKVDDNDAEVVDSGEFDASRGLTIGQLQAENPDHRLELHPRCIALRYLRHHIASVE